MNRLALWSSALLMVFAMGCMHKGGSGNSAAKSYGYGESEQDLSSETMSRPVAQTNNSDVKKNCAPDVNCMMMIEENICTFGKQLLTGSNNCESRKMAQELACQAGSTFKESDVKCLSEDDRSICNVPMACPRILRPATCSAAGLTAKGNNDCEAKANLKKLICALDVDAYKKIDAQGEAELDTKITCAFNEQR